MASAAELAILLTLQDNATSKMSSVHGVFDRFSAVAAAAGAAVMGVSGLLSDLAREAAADAAAMMAVQVATENSGVAWGDAEGEISAFIDSMRDNAAIADDVLKPALASLIAVTGDYSKSMELSSLAADLARGKNMDLKTAAELVGKVAMGNTSSLTRYGIVLKEGATATEALGELQQRFAGQAEAYGNTTRGQLESLTHRIGDFRESLGGALGAMQPVFAMLPGMSAAWTALGGVLGGTTGKMLAQTVATVAHEVASVAGTVATVAMTLAQAALNAVMSANPIALVVIAVAALAAGIIYLYNNSEDFRNLVQNLWEFLQGTFKGAIETITGVIGKLGEAWAWLTGMDGTITYSVDYQEITEATHSAGALQEAWDWFRANSTAALELIWENSSVKRTIDETTSAWDWFRTNSIRTLEIAQAAGNDAVQRALDLLHESWEWFRSNNSQVLDMALGYGADAVKVLIDGVKETWDWLQKAGRVALDISGWGIDQIKGAIEAIKAAWDWLSRNAKIFLDVVFNQSGPRPPGMQSVASFGPSLQPELVSGISSAGGIIRNFYVTVTGNTILGSERTIAIELARILKPELDAMDAVSLSA